MDADEALVAVPARRAIRAFARIISLDKAIVVMRHFVQWLSPILRIGMLINGQCRFDITVAQDFRYDFERILLFECRSDQQLGE